MDTPKKLDKNIFYLELVPLQKFEGFFALSQELATKGFSLIPIKVKDLDFCFGKKKIFVVVFTLTIQDDLRFAEARNKILDYALKRKIVNLIHINSFGEKRELSRNTLSKNYLEVKAPLSFDELVQRIDEYYQINAQKSDLWPGGRRARLPDISN